MMKFELFQTKRMGSKSVWRRYPSPLAIRAKARKRRTRTRAEQPLLTRRWADAGCARCWLQPARPRRIWQRGSGGIICQLCSRWVTTLERNQADLLQLCDDSFEEHVIATPAHLTGLHLHGLNHNTPHFSTLLPPEVTSFAEEFGFIPTKYTQFDSLSKVKAFTDRVEKDQSWEGDQIEGFVVRSTVAESSFQAAGKPPYRPGAPYFFKVKFNEPYLLYRQWRELTRVMLPYRTDLATSPDATPAVVGKGKGNAQESPEVEMWTKVRKRYQRPELAVYADWCVETMKSDPALFDDYDRGIVRVRERFLEWTEAEGRHAWAAAKSGTYKLKGNGNKKSRGKASAATAKLADVPSAELKEKWLVVPIAIPGTGVCFPERALVTRLTSIQAKPSSELPCRNSLALAILRVTM